MDYLVAIGLAAPWLSVYFLLKSRQKLNNKLLDSEKQVEALLKKYESNPSFDAQLLLASMMSGDCLYRIEAVDASNIFIRRKP